MRILIVDDHDAIRRGVLVANLPPPLVSGDPDHVFLLFGCKEFALGREAENRQGDAQPGKSISCGRGRARTAVEALR